MAILAEKERIIITPDEIKYLSVMVEDVIAFEQELERMSNEHHPTSTSATSAQGGALKQAEAVGCDGTGSLDGTEPAIKKVIQSKIGEKDGKRNPSKKGIKIFDKRLNALKEWLISLGYTLENELIKLPKNYTLETVYTDLGKYTEQIEQHKGLFVTIEIGSFDKHFWGKQKIVELTRGNKSAIL